MFYTICWSGHCCNKELQFIFYKNCVSFNRELQFIFFILIHYIAIVATKSCNCCKTAGSFAFVVISFDSDMIF